MTIATHWVWTLRIIVVGAIVALWELLAGGFGANINALDPMFFSRPSVTAVDLVIGLGNGELLSALAYTLQAALSGLVLGVASGLIVGLAFGYNRWLRILFDPIMVAFNSLPRPALGPILIIVFGLGLASKVFLSWSLVFFVVYYNTYAGVSAVDEDLTRAIRVMGATRYQVMRLVVLPSVLSWVFAALRVAVAYSLIGAIVGEFVGSTKGLGYDMMIAQGVLNIPRAYSILVLLMLMGLAMTELSRRVENRLLRWRPSEGRL